MTEPITLTAEEKPVVAGAARLAKMFDCNVSHIYKLSKKEGAPKPINPKLWPTKRWFVEDWEEFLRS